MPLESVSTLPLALSPSWPARRARRLRGRTRRARQLTRDFLHEGLLLTLLWGRLPERTNLQLGGLFRGDRRGNFFNARSWSADKKKGAAGAAPCVHEWRIVAAVQALREEKRQPCTKPVN